MVHTFDGKPVDYPVLYGVWSGGCSYSPGSVADDVELFQSIADARQEFRARFNGRGSFAYVDRAPVDVDTPAVDRDATLWLYRADPRGVVDPYPDRVVHFGPRGGVVVDPA